jgi:Skp family chaperone for outer membrane proteins
MKRTILPVALLALCWSPAIAADRLTDKDVKALVARIEQGRDRFDDALDDKVKQDTVRGPSGEVKVEHFLNDFQENIDRVEARLKPDYAASAEVATLLRQATIIDTAFRRQPGGIRGESEWNRLTTDLKTLAMAYGASFPLNENAAVRRIGDRELSEAIGEVADTAGRLKKSLDNELKRDKAIDKATRETVVAEADQLARDAKTLRNRVKDGNPSSAEADQLLAGAAKMQSIIEKHQAPASASLWTNANEPLQTLAHAYGGSWVVNR